MTPFGGVHQNDTQKLHQITPHYTPGKTLPYPPLLLLKILHYSPYKLIKNSPYTLSTPVNSLPTDQLLPWTPASTLLNST